MTEKELDALEAAAKAATPGPWRHPGRALVVSRMSEDEPLVCNCISKQFAQAPKDAAFIAAANPAVVLDLIAELRQARADACEWIDMARWLAREMGGGVIPETQWLIIARQAVKEEREAAKEATA